jgi:phosphoserine aminotransferase
MNLLGGRASADYVNTGEWSKKSIKEAKKYCTVNIAASAEDKNFTYVPPQSTWKLAETRVRTRLHQRDHWRRRISVDARHR